VQAHVGQPGYAVIDARSAEFYTGSETGGSGGSKHKSGHIAGAGSLPFDTINNVDMTLKSPDKLRAMFATAGYKAGDTIIGYCHIGQQATAMLYAARTLGYKFVLYDGAFEDWSRRDLPVAK
jgi:thiosulfate/3-mercaptopyruvate sulfurtransferase